LFHLGKTLGWRAFESAVMRVEMRVPSGASDTIADAPLSL